MGEGIYKGRGNEGDRNRAINQYTDTYLVITFAKESTSKSLK